MERHQPKGIKNRRSLSGIIALTILALVPTLSFAGNRCDYCHGIPPQDSVNGERIVETGAFKGSHAKHVTNATTTACVACHGVAVQNYSSAHAAANQFKIQIASPINGYSGSVYGTKGSSFLQTESPVTETCSNVNCHFKTETPVWGSSNTLNCDSCHTTPRGNSGSHNIHEAYFKRDLSCVECHADNTTFSHATSVSHRGVDLKSTLNYSGLGKNFLNATPFGSCSNLYCHSDGTKAVNSASFTNKVGINPEWGTPLPTDCSGCHGNYNSHAVSTGSHTSHFNTAKYGTSYICQICHSSTVDNALNILFDSASSSKHLNKNIDVTLLNGGTYSTNGHAAGGTVGSCTTYCHSSGKIGVSGVPGYNPLTWGSNPAKGCATCHGSSTTTGAPDYPERVGAGTSQANSHTKHVGVKGIGCQICHITTTLDGTTIIPGGDHLNSTKNISLSSYQSQPQVGTYNSGSMTCSATYCHGTVASPAWGGTISSGTCNSCHGDASSPATLSGKHSVHLASLPDSGGMFTCDTCHSNVAAGNNSISVETNHVNGMKNYSGAFAPRSTFNAGNCTTYCHSDGKGNTVSPGAWSGAVTLGCNGCHGTASPKGAPANGNHIAHISTTGIDCVLCHNSTTNVADKITTVANHINKSSVPAPGGTFTRSSGSVSTSFGFSANTCSNISCHSMGKFASASVAWGTASLNCSGCHATLSAGHTRHVGNLLSSVSFYGYTSNQSAGAEGGSLPNYGFGCSNCHPTDIAYHINGTVDIALAPSAGASTIKNMNLVTAGYSGSQCQNVYCHSDGKGVMATSPVWGGSFSNPDRCKNCHSNAPATGAHQAHVAGIHYDNIFSGTEGLLSAGATGNVSHGDPVQASTISCKTCHASTVLTSRNKNATGCNSCHSADAATTLAKIDAANGLAMHVNGVKNISFDITPIRSKAQIRPTSFSIYSGLWSRNGGVNNYKAGSASYDIAKVPLNNSMWNGGTSSCSNIVCHNLKGGASVNWTDTLTCESCHSQL